jgi:hypothetical protein
MVGYLNFLKDFDKIWIGGNTTRAKFGFELEFIKIIN